MLKYTKYFKDITPEGTLVSPEDNIYTGNVLRVSPGNINAKYTIPPRTTTDDSICGVYFNESKVCQYLTISISNSLSKISNFKDLVAVQLTPIQNVTLDGFHFDITSIMGDCIYLLLGICSPTNNYFYNDYDLSELYLSRGQLKIKGILIGGSVFKTLNVGDYKIYLFLLKPEDYTENDIFSLSVPKVFYNMSLLTDNLKVIIKDNITPYTEMATVNISRLPSPYTCVWQRFLPDTGTRNITSGMPANSSLVLGNFVLNTSQSFRYIYRNVSNSPINISGVNITNITPYLNNILPTPKDKIIADYSVVCTSLNISNVSSGNISVSAELQPLEYLTFDITVSPKLKIVGSHISGYTVATGLAIITSVNTTRKLKIEILSNGIPISGSLLLSSSVI